MKRTASPKEHLPKINNLLRLSLLLRLNQSPAHGYQLIQEVGQQLQQKVSASHVYPFLRELEKKKWIQSRKHERTNVFALTAEGRRQVGVMLQQFDGILESALSNKIKTCAHCGCKVFENAHAHQGKLFCCHFCADAWDKRI